MKKLTFLAPFLVFSLGCSTASHNGKSRSPSSTPAATLQEALKECYSAELTFPKTTIRINGYVLSPTQTQNVQWIAHCMVPFLPGSTQERAATAARSTWWALREGIMGLSLKDAVRFSSCNTPRGDQRQSDSPLKDCTPGRAWQVGLAAGQVPNYSMNELAQVEHTVFSPLAWNVTEADVLGWTATLAGFSQGTAEHDGIVSSTGFVRRSWLLRNPMIGSIVVGRSEVAVECLRDQQAWCTSGSYPDAIHFSHNIRGVNQAIADLTQIFLTSQSE